ncbi:hypothetical protein BGZ51_008527 [Haplosporangium sp. Z 767]|nr:hypothetical protein BGZ51_008527 [Haplosporangium sp. Z 767]KAF9196839.1 hypothetical protein BGZ50_005913 [Haplosporangium sp. Z 11]
MATIPLPPIFTEPIWSMPAIPTTTPPFGATQPSRPLSTSAIPSTTRTARSTTQTRPLFTEITEPAPSPTNNIGAIHDAEGTGAKGISGGAIAGLVIGAISILVCSVMGGLLLLKKRRKRIMTAGKSSQYFGSNGYSDTRPRGGLGAVEGRDNENGGTEKRRGVSNGLSDLWSGFLIKTHKVINGGKFNHAAMAGTAIPMQQQHQQQQQQQQQQPAPPPRMLENGGIGQPTRGMIPTYGSAHSIQTHMSGSLPPTGPLQIPPDLYSQRQLPPISGAGYMGQTYVQGIAAPIVGGQLMPPPPQQQQSSQQQPYLAYQYQPLQQQQQTPQQIITAPTNQPYYYQPGTGLVSIPHSIPPPPSPPYQQQQLPVQYAAHSYQCATPGGVNSVVCPSQPVSIVSASHLHQPPPRELQRSDRLSHPPASFPPPPHVVVDTSSSISVTNAKPAAPEVGSIFLPGDISRPLLGQGLFKIVPDAEDEEEAKLAMAAAAAAAATAPNPIVQQQQPPPLDLNLGENFLSAVISGGSQDRQLQSMSSSSAASSPSASSSSVAAITVNCDSTMSVLNDPPSFRNSILTSPYQGQGTSTESAARPEGVVTNSESHEYRREIGHHDRLIGQKGRPNNNPRFLIDREGVANDKQELSEGEAVTRTERLGHGRDKEESGVVIVGSDIVLEPLPSVKAAAKAAQEAAATKGEPDPTRVPEIPANGDGQATRRCSIRPSSPTMRRDATIGEMLPTMGTEEYLERTDDKEEYNIGLHGDRQAMVGSSMGAAPIIHPVTTAVLAEEAQGDIVHSGAPGAPLSLTTTATALETEALPVIATPPPIVRSTKPKLKKH